MNMSVVRRVQAHLEEEAGAAEASGLLRAVVRAAACYFEECPEDFILWSVSPWRLVFGHSNRLAWCPWSGFLPAGNDCTQAFLERCRQLGAVPGRGAHP